MTVEATPIDRCGENFSRDVRSIAALKPRQRCTDGRLVLPIAIAGVCYVERRGHRLSTTTMQEPWTLYQASAPQSPYLALALPAYVVFYCGQLRQI